MHSIEYLTTLVDEMLKLGLQYLSIFLLVIVTVVGAYSKPFYESPRSNSTTLNDCCKESALSYSRDAITFCKNVSYNSTRSESHIDLVLMDNCEIYCYLNYSGVIEDDGTVRKERFIDFLKEYLPSEDIKLSLDSFTDQCLREIDFMKNDKNFGLNCQPYFAALIDCIQEEVFTKCPTCAENSLEVCSAGRSFMQDCTANEWGTSNGYDGQKYNTTSPTIIIDISESSSDYSSEYSEYSDSESKASSYYESESSESESDESDYNYDTDTYAPPFNGTTSQVETT